jgi:hypothetical protein
LLVLGRHVPHLGFLQVLLADEPALATHQQIYRRLIRKAVADASAVALAEIEEKGWERGLDDSMGRMVVLAEADRELGRLNAEQVDAIVDGTDEVLDFLAESREDGTAGPSVIQVSFECLGGRGEIDDAAAAILAFALRQNGVTAARRRRGEKLAEGGSTEQLTIDVICYASHPSDAVRRYNMRKLRNGIGRARHAVIDYEVAPAPGPIIPGAVGPGDVLAGDLATLCRLAIQHAATVAPHAATTQ